MSSEKQAASNNNPVQNLLRVLQGALIGLGAVLPGVSGGVLCVIFKVYQPLMEVLSNPAKALKKHCRLLLPVIIGVVLGFLGVAKLLGFLLDKYPDPSVCLLGRLYFGIFNYFVCFFLFDHDLALSIRFLTV